MGLPVTTGIPDMEDRSFKEGREAKVLRKVTIITLEEVEVDLRRMDVQTRILVARKALEAKEENHSTKVMRWQINYILLAKLRNETSKDYKEMALFQLHMHGKHKN